MAAEMHEHESRPHPPWGLMAEFEHAEELIEATRAAHARGYGHFEAYSPFPVGGLPEAMGRRATRLPFITLCGGVFGALFGYGLQYWTSVIDYPINVGGRPYHSWPAFIPVTFEMTILFAALASVIGMFALNGLPKPYHPVFNEPDFRRATQDRFFLCIESRDPLFDIEETRRFLESLAPMKVVEVEA